MFYFAEHIYILIISRLFQGFSAAVLLTVGLAVLVDTVGKEKMGQMAGYAFSSLSGGLVIGPLLGGFVYARSGYLGVNLMMFVLVLLDIIFRLVMIEKKFAVQWLDPMKTEEEEARTTIVDNSNHSTDADNRPSSQVHLEQAASRMPSILILLRSPRLLAAMYGVFVTCIVAASFDGVLPLFVKHTFGWGSAGAGLIFLTIAAPAVIGPLAGWLSDNYGPRWISASGLLLTSVLVVLLRLVHDESKAQVILLCFLLTMIGGKYSLLCRLSSRRGIADAGPYLAGIGLNCCTAPLAGDLSFTVEQSEKARPGQFGQNGAYAQAFALLNSAVAGAIILGPTIAGLVQVKVGWAGFTIVLAVVCASGALPVVRSLTGVSCSAQPLTSRVV